MPRARAVVRVWSASVSVSVSRLCALLVLPSFVNFGGQVQVKSKSGRIRKSHPAWPQSPYWPSPPPGPISFPAHHQGEPNSPGFPFPFDQRPESWLILTAWDLTLSAKTQFPRCLLCLPGHCILPRPAPPTLLAASTGCPHSRLRLSLPPPPPLPPLPRGPS